MTYQRIQPYTKEEAEVAFVQGTSEQIGDALLGVTYYVEDWRWVQGVCLAALDRSDTFVQEIAILCLGHLATFHKTLDLAIVLPALQAHASQPELMSALNRALDDIASGVEDTSYFEEKWDELPQRIKEGFIKGGFFNMSGKRISKRNFISTRENETPEQVSHDLTLVAQLKQHYAAFSSHDWQEYYDEQGRLLRLSLEGLGLVQPPAELWQFTSLQELNLSENQLSSLPAELVKLVNLESLNLSRNEFSRLPAGLEQLINLQELYLHMNRLRSLSSELGALANLHELDLSQNQLSSLPAELGQLINLEWLVLRQNQFNSLPAELGQLVNLLVFDLSQNPQLQIPPPDVVQEGISAVLAYLRALS